MAAKRSSAAAAAAAAAARIAAGLALLASAALGSSCAESGGGQTGSGGNVAGASGGGTTGAGGSVAGGGGASGGDAGRGGAAGTATGGGGAAGAMAGAGAGGTGGGAAGTSANGGVSGGSGGSGGSGSSGMGGAPGGRGGGAGAGGAAAGGAAGSAGRGGSGGSGGMGGVPSLYQRYASYFPIGAAVDSSSYNTHAAILTKHFNSVVAEDQMKFDALQPNQGSFTYTAADRIVQFAQTNNMQVRGHALVWHRQNPAWVFANASRDVLLTRMRDHINSVMRHFQGKVYAWDVVNEAIMNDGRYRTGDETAEDQRSSWHKIIGDSYIAEAFKAARAADPNAKLFYNDYYNYLPAKRDAIYNMLKGLLDSGVVVHGVGLQAHLNIEPSTDMTHQGYYQTVANMEAAIVKYASLGLEVQVTEMDLSLYIPCVTYTSDMFYTTATFTDALQTKQAERYRAFFDLFRAHRDVITGVTLWGIADDNTWLSEFSSGRKDFPLLFDVNHNPKKAFWAVVDF
jgi:endo-1,4-beta-xylanase